MSKSKIGGVIAGVVIIGGLVLGMSCTEKIKPGYVGVIYSIGGGIDGETLGK